MTDSAQSPERDFFISYTGSDRPWAEWIGWILEEAGYTVFIDVWDFRAGKNFALEMQKGTQCKKTIAVLSQQYLEADYTNPEWAAAFADDPRGDEGKLIPIRVEAFDPKGFLKAIVYIDFVGISEQEAEARLLNALKPRGKPDTRPSFPVSPPAEAGFIRSVMERVGFPGLSKDDTVKEENPEQPSTEEELTNSNDAENGSRNPFWPRKGVIEDPAQFFNCEGTLNRIFESLNSGSSVAIIGEPNMGKSSLLRAVGRMAPEYLESPRQTVLLNLATVFSEQDFYEDLCEALEMETVSGNEFVRKMKKQDQQVLLLLDEVEQIGQEKFTYKIRQELRGLAEGNNAPLRLVIASRTSLDQLFEGYQDGQTSPMEGITVEEHVEPWSEPTCRNFITTRLTDDPIQFTQREIDQIIRASDGNPQKLTQACHKLYNRYRET